MNLTEHGGELTMTEQKAQSSAGSTTPSASRIDPVALATLVCVVMMMATSFWNLWNLNRRISAIEAVVGARPAGPDPDRIYAVNTEGAPTKGPDNALVTIVEFSDFECPFCAKVVPTLEADRGDVQGPRARRLEALAIVHSRRRTGRGARSRRSRASKGSSGSFTTGSSRIRTNSSQKI
jgi:hypothetical protein